MMLNKSSGNFQFKNFETVGIIIELLTYYVLKMSNISKDNNTVLKVFGTLNFSDSFIPTHLGIREKLLA